jgi:hypothetical protein
MAALADAIAGVLGPDVSAQIRDRVGAITDQMKGLGLALDGWSADAAFAHIFDSILKFGVETGDEMARWVRGAVGQFTGDMEAMAARLQSALQFVVGVKAFADSAPTAVTATASLSDNLAKSAERIRDLVDGFDNSVDQQQQLLGAVNERYQLEIAYLTQIRLLGEQISAALYSTAQSIETAFFDPQQQYDFQQNRVNMAQIGLRSAGSAEEVAFYSGIINQGVQEAWRLLLQANPDEARRLQGDFLGTLQETDAAVFGRLSTFEQEALAESDRLRVDLTAMMSGLALAADNLAIATNNMAVATASIPERINVNVIVRAPATDELG